MCYLGASRLGAGAPRRAPQGRRLNTPSRLTVRDTVCALDSAGQFGGDQYLYLQSGAHCQASQETQ